MARLASLSLGVGVWLPLVSLPPFALGYWDKAEPLVVGLHAVSFVAAIALALAALRSPRLVADCLRHPFVVLPMALAAWSAAVAPGMDLPWLSLSGSPQSGMGALWHLDFGLLVAAARLARTDDAGWRGLEIAALASVAIVAAIKVFDWRWEVAGGTHLLIWVAAYYAWLGIALPAVMVAGNRARSAKLVLTVLAVAAMAIAAGRSSTAAIAAGVGGACFWGARRFTPAGWLLGVVVAAFAILPGALLIAVPQVAGTLASLDDRRSLLLMMWSHLSGDPLLHWVTGLGWGRTQDVFQANLLASGQRLWDGSWIFMSSDYFHSHNLLAESLIAAGVPGMALSLAWLVSLPLACAPERRALAFGFASSLAAVSALWFPLALSLPLIALAAAAVSPEPTSQGRPLPFVFPALVCAALVAAVAAGALFYHGRTEQAGPVRDLAGGDLAAAETIRDAFLRMESLDEAARQAALPVARAMLDHLDHRIPETHTALLPVVGLSVMAQIRTTRTLAWLEPEVSGLTERWERWLDAAWRLMPARSDLAINLCADQAVNGRFDRLAVVVDRLLRRNPADPVGLYFGGLLAVRDAAPEGKVRGMAMLQASVDRGIERLMPLDPSLAPLLAGWRDRVRSPHGE